MGLEAKSVNKFDRKIKYYEIQPWANDINLFCALIDTMAKYANPFKHRDTFPHVLKEQTWAEMFATYGRL